MKKGLPIGYDNFREIREEERYYVDKSMFIKNFIQCGEKVALITRPRRFGKTLNMSMLREFCDITKDSKSLFEGLAIMDTESKELINSKPVIYLSFKDCTGTTVAELLSMLVIELFKEFRR